VCWVSGTEKKRASPSLRSCYATTETACCNYVEDVAIGGDYSNFIPEPCVDNTEFKEIQIFMCFACRGASS